MYYSEAPGSGSSGPNKPAAAEAASSSGIGHAGPTPHIRILQGPSEDPSKAIVWELTPDGSGFVKHKTASSPGGGAGSLKDLRALPVKAVASVTAYLLPYGYPRTVSPSYQPYASWAFMGMLFSSISGVLSTQSLLYAIGVGAGSVPIAAALNWVLKDGLGQLGGVLSAALINNRFDSDPKRWRFISAVAQDASTFLEILTPLMPQAFLPLAALANVGKNISWLSASATRAGIHNSLAIRGNLADVTAKAGSQTITASTIGMLGGIVLSPIIGSDPKHILVAFLVCSFLHLTSVFQSLRRVVLPTLSARRLAIATSPFFALVEEQQQQRHNNGSSGSSAARGGSPALNDDHIPDWSAIPVQQQHQASAAAGSDESVGAREAVRLVEMAERRGLLNDSPATMAFAPGSLGAFDYDDEEERGSGDADGDGSSDDASLVRSARQRVLNPSEVGKLERFAPLIGGMLASCNDAVGSAWAKAKQWRTTRRGGGGTASAETPVSHPSATAAALDEEALASRTRSHSAGAGSSGGISVTSNRNDQQGRSLLSTPSSSSSTAHTSSSASAVPPSPALRRILGPALDLDLRASAMVEIGPALGKGKGAAASVREFCASLFNKSRSSSAPAPAGHGLGSHLFAFAEASGAIPSAAVALAGGPVTGAAVLTAAMPGRSGGAAAFVAEASGIVSGPAGLLTGVGPNVSRYVVAVSRNSSGKQGKGKPTVQVYYTHDASWRDCLVAYLHAHFVARALLLSPASSSPSSSPSPSLLLSRDLEAVRSGLAFVSAYGDRLIQDLEVMGWWVGQPLLERDYNKRLRWAPSSGGSEDNNVSDTDISKEAAALRP